MRFVQAPELGRAAAGGSRACRPPSRGARSEHHRSARRARADHRRPAAQGRPGAARHRGDAGRRSRRSPATGAAAIVEQRRGARPAVPADAVCVGARAPGLSCLRVRAAPGEGDRAAQKRDAAHSGEQDDGPGHPRLERRARNQQSQSGRSHQCRCARRRVGRHRRPPRRLSRDDRRRHGGRAAIRRDAGDRCRA